ncbi:MAG: alkane 1-monooxygenase [Bacteroidota bacterium]
MMRDAKYLIAYLAPLSAFAAVLWQGAWSFSTVVLAFVLIPLGEQFVAGTTRNLPSVTEEKKAASPFFDWLLYLNVPLLFALLWLYFSTITTAELAAWEMVGITLSVGNVVGTIGINVAHELGHRQTRHEQFLAKMLLTTALYTHFFIEHNRGHHRRVGTWRDPATARFGENLYLFWLRSMTTSYLHAWQLEAKRLGSMYKPAFSVDNEMIWFQLAQAGYLGLVGWQFGWMGVGFAIAVALTGILLLETVNYIEHYGLFRKRLPSGFYEKTTPKHSWNSNHELGRIFLYELTRHSDHHFKATRKYQVLRHFDESPQLPHGYPVSMLMALVPPLWFGGMNRKVREMNG